MLGQFKIVHKNLQYNFSLVTYIISRSCDIAHNEQGRLANRFDS
nr:MAG TPA: hypothetical protein [Caudoviricetes sp.]